MTTNPKVRHPLTTATIIHLFALAHAAVALTGRALNYYDDFPLTILTISMVVLISIRHRLQLEVAAIVTFIACFVGLLAGLYGALELRVLLRSDLLAPTLTTFILTELVGWATYLIALRRRSDDAPQTGWAPLSTHIIVIAALILFVRVGYMFLLRYFYDGQEAFFPELRRVFSNTPALLLLICCNLICVHLYNRNHERIRPRWSQPIWIILILAAISTLSSLVICYLPAPGREQPVTPEGLFRLSIIILLVCIGIFALLSLSYYVVTSHRELNRERHQRHLAQYQYSKFKQQINPHFLFNSLNILDGLVQEEQTERASAFIHKLAGLYRYMLRNEGEALVTLRDEMEFADAYLDLIKERFSDGLSVRKEIPAESLSCMVVPCSVQQLIENATKHNIVSPEEPLQIRLTADREWLTVENTLQPRLSRRGGSTRLGLKTISQQYADIASRDIRVVRTGDRFRVDLPLLKPVKP